MGEGGGNDRVRVEFGDGLDVAIRAKARLVAARKTNEVRYAADPWAFLCEAVWTLDQRGGDGGGIRQYPGARMQDPVACGCVRWKEGEKAVKVGCVNYLEHLTWEWVGHNRLLIPKSRRLMISWTLTALHYWLARYRPASLIGFATRKYGNSEDEGSCELVKRAKFIHDHLPPFVQPRPIRYAIGKLSFVDNDSTILAVAQGADQARQYTYTAYLADEFAFWEQAAATYAALYPTLEGGGRFTGCSSAAPGFMEQLVHDTWLTEAR